MKEKDDVITEVRANRESTFKEFLADPEKFLKDAHDFAKKLGIRKSPLKAREIDFSKLRKKKLSKKAA